MSKFEELFYGDMARYQNKAKGYIKYLLYFFRKAQTVKQPVLRKCYDLLFKSMALKHGIEMSPFLTAGKGLYIGHPYNITINPKATLGENCNIHKGVLIGQTNRGGVRVFL